MSALADRKEKDPVTVVVRQRVKKGREPEFEVAMRDFIGFVLSSPGHLSIHGDTIFTASAHKPDRAT